MIKLGIFGDQTTNQQLLNQVNALPEVESVGLYFSGNVESTPDFELFASPGKLMETSDAILVLTNKSISHDLVKIILRNSKPVYLQSVPNLHIKEIKELVDLEKEAGIVTSIYNPFTYNPYLTLFASQYEKPFLINLRTCFDSTAIKPSLELLLLVTALNRIAQSNFKKLDVFGIRSIKDQLIMSVRLEYENGCVANFTITQENENGLCEIFQKSGIVRFEIESSFYQHFTVNTQQIDAIRHFLGRILNQDKKSGSFDGLMQSVQIVHEIREHLRFNEIVF
jgi:Predicted dehydrogenases and related proteins